MNRTAGSTKIGTAAFLRRCGRPVVARRACVNRVNVDLRCKKFCMVGCLIGLVIMLLLVASNQLHAEPAHFWISPSNIAPAGPGSSTIPGINGNVRFLNIWAQPATVGAGAWNAATNPFKQLENVSLNLVANNSVVEFLNDSIIVHNPPLGSSRRFEFVHDSRTGLVSDASLPDRIAGIQAFSITADGGYSGIGSACNPNDSYCAATPSGTPAWLLATVAARTIADAGSAEFRLQIGERGMNHVGELTSQTMVVFGNAVDPVYNAGCDPITKRCADRQVTLAGDAPDFVLQAAPSSAAQAMHWQGSSGQWSNNNWSIIGRAPTWTDNAFLDAGLGQNAVIVSGFQQANLTTVNGGRLHIAENSSLASEVVVNAGASISGDGSIDSNLTLRGNLTVSSSQSLKVFGRADITGGGLGLLDGYTQAPNTISDPFVVLEALGGIQGRLSTVINSQLGDGLFLEQIDYDTDPTKIFVQIKSVTNADYNNDGVVNAADYVVWRKSLGTPSGYNLWRASFGQIAAAGSISSRNMTVPEPRFAAIVICGVVLLARQRSELVCMTSGRRRLRER